jgi:hypothetical protein
MATAPSVHNGEGTAIKEGDLSSGGVRDEWGVRDEY